MATEHFLRWVEGQAESLRQICHVPPFGRLDPFELASRMGVIILRPNEIAGLAAEICDQLMLHDAKAWSAGSLHLPDSRQVVVLNPVHQETRQRASLMEELSHIHLRHKPTQLIAVNGIVLRTLNKSQETEAFWVGSAALVPGRVIKGARTRRMTAGQVALEHCVSIELVAFRAKVLGISLNPIASHGHGTAW